MIGTKVSRPTEMVHVRTYMMWYMYLTEVGLTPGGRRTVHIYTQTIHRVQRTEHT
jgi:hypothetical protein